MKNSNRMQEESKDEIETEEFIPYNEIDKLQNMGINAADLTKLKTAGPNIPLFSYCNRILHCDVSCNGNKKRLIERKRNF